MTTPSNITSLEVILNVSGSCSSDMDIAHKFVKECSAAIVLHLTTLKALKNLEMVLSAESFNAAIDSVIAIRQIFAALNEAAAFHKNGSLSASIGKPECDHARKQLEEANNILKTLRDIRAVEFDLDGKQAE
jgi:hypothetical protein